VRVSVTRVLKNAEDKGYPSELGKTPIGAAPERTAERLLGVLEVAALACSRSLNLLREMMGIEFSSFPV